MPILSESLIDKVALAFKGGEQFVILGRNGTIKQAMTFLEGVLSKMPRGPETMVYTVASRVAGRGEFAGKTVEETYALLKSEPAVAAALEKQGANLADALSESVVKRLGSDARSIASSAELMTNLVGNLRGVVNKKLYPRIFPEDTPIASEFGSIIRGIEPGAANRATRKFNMLRWARFSRTKGYMQLMVAGLTGTLSLAAYSALAVGLYEGGEEITEFFGSSIVDSSGDFHDAAINNLRKTLGIPDTYSGDFKVAVQNFVTSLDNVAKSLGEVSLVGANGKPTGKKGITFQKLGELWDKPEYSGVLSPVADAAARAFDQFYAAIRGIVLKAGLGDAELDKVISAVLDVNKSVGEQGKVAASISGRPQVAKGGPKSAQNADLASSLSTWVALTKSPAVVQAVSRYNSLKYATRLSDQSISDLVWIVKNLTEDQLADLQSLAREYDHA